MALAADSLDALASQWGAVPYRDASDRFVIGDVRPGAEILLIGEAPGEDEDEQGLAFVGAAGKRLDTSLARAGMQRGDVSIANVFPRRPRDNRDPTLDEIRLHSPYIDRLVGLHPNLKAVGLMGGAALLWKTGQEKIKAYRGEEFERGGVWWVPMLHPASTLYRPSDHKWVVQDLQWIKTLRDGDLLDTRRFHFDLITDPDALSRLSSEILSSPYCYVDIETSAEPPASPLWWWDGRVRPVLISFGWFRGDEPDAAVVEATEDTMPAVAEMLAGNPRYWSGSSALYFDVPLLRRIGVPVVCRGSFLDTLTISRLNDENRGCGAKDLAKRHLRAVYQTPYWGEHEEGAWQSRWREWETFTPEERRERVDYSGKDSLLGVQVVRVETERLRQNRNLVRAYRGLMGAQSRAMSEMSRVGMPIDLKAAAEMSARLGDKMAEIAGMLQDKIPEESKPVAKSKKSRRKQPDLGLIPEEPDVVKRNPVNFSSPAQMSRLIFGHAKLPTFKVTDSGDRASADRIALLKCLDHEQSPSYPPWAFEVIRGVLHLRDIEKAKGYVDSLIDAAGVSEDGRIHSMFKTGPVTWRIASEGPNLQQLQGEGSKYPVKPLFAAPEGWVFVRHDYKGLEVCGLADQSRDTKLVRRIKDDEDLHWRHATGFMALDYGSTFPVRKKGVNNLYRQAFKTCFFASGYGAGPGKLADTLRKEFYDIGIGRDVVVQILSARGAKVGKDIYYTLSLKWLDWLDEEYPGLKASSRRMAVESGRTMVVSSKFGIERRLPDIRDLDDQIRSEAERQAYNFTPQNLSMLTFLAYRELEQVRRDMELEDQVFLVMQEHDSLLWLCRVECAELWEAAARHKMEKIDWGEWDTDFAVPLTAEGSIDAVWR